MIGTVRISQLPTANTLTGAEDLIVNQSLETRLTTVNDVVGLVTYVASSGIATYSNTSGIATYATSSGIATYATTAGISTVSEGLTGTPSISVTTLSVSGVSTLGTVQVSSGIVTASSGIVTYYGDGSKLENIISGVGIQSSGTVVGTGITTLNFIGAGNTFAVNGSTVDISIQGGGGGESYWALSTLGIHTTSNVGIATTNPIQPLQVGSAGTSVVVVNSSGDVGIGTTNPDTKLHVVGDINLDDGGSFVTTVQCVTPTANRTISFPDRTGTVALVAGSSGQAIYNNGGALEGINTMTFDGTTVTMAGRWISSLNGAASAPPVALTGTWFTGGTATTTKPHVLIEPAGTTSTAWSTAGTGLGVNAPSGFAGNLLDLQVNGTSGFRVSGGSLTLSGTIAGISNTSLRIQNANNSSGLQFVNSGISVTGWLTCASFSGKSGVTPDAVTVSGGSATSGSNPGATLSLVGGNSVGGAGASVHIDGGSGTSDGNIIIGATRGNLQITDARNVILGTTTGTKIGTATTQKLGFYNAAPVVQPTAVADITTTATSGSLPTPDGTVTIADATTPTVTELLEYCVELEAKLEAALSRLRDLGLIAT